MSNQNQTLTTICTNCGASLKFKPGQDENLKCPYCGTVNKIQKSKLKVEEIDIKEIENHDDEIPNEKLEIKCPSCGAGNILDENVVIDSCKFCGGHISAFEKTKKNIKPKSIASFKIEQKKAQQKFKDWSKKIWFAPNSFAKHLQKSASLKGVYLPFWTFDMQTETDYQGQRGIYEYYETKNDEGETVRHRKTNWFAVSGHVSQHYDDVIIAASEKQDKSKQNKSATFSDHNKGFTVANKDFLKSPENWNLAENLLAFKEDYTVGFQVRSYTLSPKIALNKAKNLVEIDIENLIKRDIGGDEQRISTKNIDYSDLTYKQTLLPFWISSYNYKGKIYGFSINGITGKVYGQRPWSVWKISLTVFVGLILILILILIIS